MENKNKSTKWSKNDKRSKRRRGNSNKAKEVEFNIPETSLNKADLPHVLTQGANNDYTWYTKVNPAYKDIASINFSILLGSAFDIINKGSYIYGSGRSNTLQYDARRRGATIPGIMTLRLAPLAGISTDPTSALNIGAQQLYAQIRKANAGAKNYDKTDVMMVVLAMSSAYMLFEELCRGYKSLTTINARNRYMPTYLANALGYSTNLMDSLADFRAAINLFAYQLAAINIPDVFTLIKRQSWLYEHVYKDADDEMAQMYAYVPDGYYIWTEGTDDSPTYLKYITREQLFGIGEGAYVSTLSQVRNAINTVLQPILGSQDLGVISGDIEKAFPGKLINLQPINENEFIDPVYDKEVLLQMSNATVYNGTLINADVTQVLTNLTTGPYLRQIPSIQTASNAVAEQLALRNSVNPMLNFIDVDTTPENVLVATRLVSTVSSISVGATSQYANLLSAGSEVCVSATLWQTQSDASGMVTGVNTSTFNQFAIFDVTTAPNTQTVLQPIMAWSKFDWAPVVHAFVKVSSASGGDTMNYQGAMFDANRFTPVSFDNVKALNDLALMSEYYCEGAPSNTK